MSSLDVRAIDEAELKKAPRPKTKHELTVFLAEEAFDRAVERGTADTTREIGGVLVGEVLRDDSGPYLKIETTIDALHAEEKGAELTFTHATWDHINTEMDTKHQGKKVVGWYHTHPGFGVFLSDRDQFIHKSFFNLPFQVALVYDPKSKEHGVFTWRDNEVWRLRRYVIGNREHTWDGNRTTARPTDKADKADQPEADKPARDGADEPLFGSSLVPFVMVAVVLMLIAGFAGYWLASSSANTTLMQAQVEINKARGDGAQLALASVQADLVDVLRDTLGDEAMRKPVAQAAAELDTAIASLEKLRPAPAPGAAPADPTLDAAIAQLRGSRDALTTLTTSRGSAASALAALDQLTRQGGELRANLVEDVRAQRAGIGMLYAELATDVAKTDAARARRLLANAAHLDPGNYARYDAQLQTFAPGTRLPRDPTEGGKP